VRFYLALATALYRGEETAFAEMLAEDTLALLASPPSPPSDVPVDERVLRLARPSPDEEIAAVKELTPPKPLRLAVGFSSSSVPTVATAAKLMGFIPGVVQPGPSINAPSEVDADLKARSSAEGMTWAAVLSGDPEFIAEYLDGLESATVRFVCADRDTLDELGLDDVEAESLAASEIGYGVTSPNEVVTLMQGQGYRAIPAKLGDVLGEHDVAVVDVAARVARWMKDTPQALVVSGPESSLAGVRGRTSAFDTVAYCADLLWGIGCQAVLRWGWC
jgi:hypothetical protein